MFQHLFGVYLKQYSTF